MMKQIKYILLSLVLLLPVALSAMPVITQVKVENGKCRNGGKMTIIATNLAENVKYAILGISGDAKDYYMSQDGNNIFEDLPSGKYDVMVYDSDNQTIPAKSTADVKNTYTELGTGTPTIWASDDVDRACGATYIAYATNGQAPYKFTLTNLTTNEVWEQTTPNKNYRFLNLPEGEYQMQVEDACGELRVRQETNTIELPLLGLEFNTLEFNASASGNGACDKIKISAGAYANRGEIIINGSDVLPDEYKRAIYYAIEYPAMSGELKDWRFANNSVDFQLDGYNASAPGNYRVAVRHPCTNVITYSQVYTLPSPTIGITGSQHLVYENFCDLPSNVSLEVWQKTTGVTNYICDNYDLVVQEFDGTYIKTVAWDGTGKKVIEGFTPGKKYHIILETAGVEVARMQLSANTASYKRLDMVDAQDDGFYATYPYNFGTTGDFDSGAIYVKMGYSDNYTDLKHPITFSILSGPVTRPPFTLPPEAEARGILWDDLPHGTYKIRVEYDGCSRVEEKTVILKKIVSAFKADEPQIIQSVNCGEYTIKGRGTYFDTANQPFLANSKYVVEMKVKKEGAVNYYRVDGKSTVDLAVDRLQPGKYEVQYINGNVAGSRGVVYATYELILPEYQAPIVTVAQSGGITCEGLPGKMTVTATGTSSDFEYRYKVKDAPDNSYSPWQAENFFTGLHSMTYTVQVKDNCGGTTTQDIKVFNGSDQFVQLIGGYNNNTVCKGMSAELSVMAIGPVDWYQWSKDGVDIDGATKATFPITDMKESDTGVYKVRVSNGLCELESSLEIKIMDVFELGDDFATVLSLETQEIDVLANDLIAMCYTPSGYAQTLTKDKIQVEGYAKGVVEGDFGKIEIVNNKIQYTAPQRYFPGVVNITYDVECTLEGIEFTDKGSLSIFVLQPCSELATVCEGNNYNACFFKYPSGKTTIAAKDGSTVLTLPHMYTNLVADKTIQVTPEVDGIEYPTVDFTIRVIPAISEKLRWTGSVDHNWNNNKNWVKIKPDGTNGAISDWAPSHCVDVEIPGALNRYPIVGGETSSVRDIEMKDRAMLLNTHRLAYNSTTFDIKFKGVERGHWLMYSAPLTTTYSGDFMLLDGLGEPVKKLAYMSFFQSEDPDMETEEVAKTITRPFSNVEQKLNLGKSFFLKVDENLVPNQSHTFPKMNTKYTYYTAHNWNNLLPVPVESATLVRSAKGRFITDETLINPNNQYTFKLVSPDDMEGSEVIMITNPFTSYLEVKKFLVANAATLEPCFLIWDGAVGSFIKLDDNDGTLYIDDVAPIKANIATDQDYISPMQSFFVVKKDKSQKATLIYQPEEITTVTPNGIIGDYELK